VYNKSKTNEIILFLFMNNSKNKVFLIRHAQSLSNNGERTSSPENNLLTPTGINQAEELAKTISIKPSLIIYSSYKRTYLTAEPLIKKYPQTPHEEWDFIHEFTYLNREHCANTTPQERKPLVINYWAKMDPNYSDGGNAETFSNLIVRIKLMLSTIKDRPEENIFIFTHGQFIEATKIILNNPFKTDTEIMKIFMRNDCGKTIKNCQITELDGF
jgi:broad specificity phosphatase PhoE